MIWLHQELLATYTASNTAFVLHHYLAAKSTSFGDSMVCVCVYLADQVLHMKHLMNKVTTSHTQVGHATEKTRTHTLAGAVTCTLMQTCIDIISN